MPGPVTGKQDQDYQSLSACLNRCFMHTVTVLVCLGSYNKIPYTRCLINNINFFLIVLQTGRVKMLADLASGENLLPSSQTASFSLWPQMAEEARRGLFYNGTNPITLGTGFQHINLQGRHKYSVYSKIPYVLLYFLSSELPSHLLILFSAMFI